MRDGRLLVVCKGDRSLDVLDLRAGASVGTVTSSGHVPHEVVASGDGTICYLPVYSDSPVGVPGSDGRAIDLIDLVSLARTATVTIDYASRPHLPQVGPEGLLYVSTELDESLSIFDPDTMRLVARIPTGAAHSHMFAFAPDAATIAVANVSPGTVSVIDVKSGSLRGIVEVAGRINRIAFDSTGHLAFTADQERARLAVVDTRTMSVAGWIDLPGIGFGSAVTKDGKYLVIALRSASQIAILDLANRSVVAAIDVPAHPQAIVLDPNGRYAYSACDVSDVVVEVDLEQLRVMRVIPTGRNPDGLAWAPLPAKPSSKGAHPDAAH